MVVAVDTVVVVVCWCMDRFVVVGLWTTVQTLWSVVVWLVQHICDSVAVFVLRSSMHNK